MIALGYILFWLGMAAWVAGSLMFLAVAFRYSIAWFFGCLFVPFADVAYFLLYPKQTWKPLLIGTVGMLVAGIGHLLAT
jgi:hypothetical protein